MHGIKLQAYYFAWRYKHATTIFMSDFKCFHIFEKKKANT